MIKANAPASEIQRLKALNDYEVLDTEAEQVFDDLTQLASEICGTPISLISLIDPDRQWFKSKVGLGVNETHRDIAFCSHAILQKEIFEVPNALEDERFFDNPLVTSDPNIRFYAGTPLQTPTGHNIGTLCVISDQPNKLSQEQRNSLEILGREVISQLELRIRNKKLEAASQYKTEYLANISHEIRTPLNAIVGLSELALHHERFADINVEIQSYLDKIHFSGKSLLGIINSVLDLSKIEAAKMELNEVNCNIYDLIENTINLLKYRAEQAGITLYTRIDDDCNACVFIDEQKLSQVLTNILTNAIKFTPEGKTIKLSAWLQNHHLHVEIEDQGIGIKEENLALLFNKYIQVGKKKTSQEGTGLGLTITKGLVDVMSGSIKMTSVEGVGTSVAICIPFKSADCEDKTDTPLTTISNLNDKKALVVEDNLVNQAVISAMLTKLGIEFTMVAEGEKALKILKQDSFDFILMDINLPGISGIEVTRKLKSNALAAPIIALTADVFRSNREKSLFDGFLTKPVQLEQLKSEVLAVLNKNTV